LSSRVFANEPYSSTTSRPATQIARACEDRC
jgi:hypothetical protein